MATEKFTTEEIQLRFLRRFAFHRPNPEIWPLLSANAFLKAAEALEWIESPPDTPIRVERIGKYKAVDAHLFDGRLKFGDYLICENLFQGWLSSRADEPLDQMARGVCRRHSTFARAALCRDLLVDGAESRTRKSI